MSSAPFPHVSHYWWQRDDLLYKQRAAGHRLFFSDYDVTRLANRRNQPTYIYSMKRAQHNVRRLTDALKSAGLLRARILYAMKANRFPPLVTSLKFSGMCGIDASSPGEVELALSCGFQEKEISYTAHSVSNTDIEYLTRHSDVFCNCDSISSIRRLGHNCQGRPIGIRINPDCGAGSKRNSDLTYCGGDKKSKFGIYREQWRNALAAAKEYGMSVQKIHFHTGCGILTPSLPELIRVFQQCRWFIDQLPDLRAINVGGGLGVPHTEAEKPLDLKHWAELLRKHFGQYDVELEVEPGEYIVKDAGLLLLQCTMVEQKKDNIFVGLDGGFNLAVEPVFYHYPFQPVPCLWQNRRPLSRVTISGNINEAQDIWADNICLPLPKEGDDFALINAGAYSSSMASNHCLRGHFREILLV